MDFLTLEKLPYSVSFPHYGRIHANPNMIIDCDYEESSSVSSTFLVCKKVLLTVPLVLRRSGPTSARCA